MRRVAAFLGLLLFLSGAAALARAYSAWDLGARPSSRTGRTARATARATARVTARATARDQILFGDLTLESAQDKSPAGVADAFRFLDGNAGTAHSIAVYVDSGTRAKRLLVGLYGDRAGLPAKLLGVGTIPAPTDGSWDIAKIGDVPVLGGRAYWVIVLAKGGRLVLRARSRGACQSEITRQGALPASWAGGRRSRSCPASAFVAGAMTTAGSLPIRSGPTPAPPVSAPTPPPLAPLAGPSPPVDDALPSIFGTALAGRTVTSSAGSWTNDPTAYSYVWEDCDAQGAACAPVAGATTSTYAITDGDVGSSLRVVVTATNGGGSVPATSAPTAVVTVPPPSNSSLPTVAGSSVVGDVLSASGGGWSGSPRFGYQWRDCSSGVCSDIQGATGSTFTVRSADVGSAVDVVVTATNGGGSVPATSAPTAVVTVPPPSNSSLPTVAGSAVVGDVLSASSGGWSGSPRFGYQWQDCSSGVCSDIQGATGSTFTVRSADVGSAIDVVVTATNGGGSVPATSAPTVAATAGCATTLDPGASLADAISSANDGATICLSAGSYGAVSLTDVWHAGYVTVEPAPGATATVAGISTSGVSFLRFQGLKVTDGINFQDSGAASHDLQVLDDDITGSYGVVINGNVDPIYNVLVEGNYIHNLDTGCTSGYAGGQGVTNYWGTGITISHNTFQSIGWHYIQGGAVDSRGMTVDHNLFEGPWPTDTQSCAHLNVWQIWFGGTNDSFTNNVVSDAYGSAATDSIIFETGSGGADCSRTLSNTVIDNNLFNGDDQGAPIQMWDTQGLQITNNTLTNGAYGVWAVRQCSGSGRVATTDANISHNISVNQCCNSDGTPYSDFTFGLDSGTCTTNCQADYNVSSDDTASSTFSGYTTHYVTNWTPQWVDTAGYQPVGLPFAAGYQGGGGP